jgi:hypothetical protein
MNRINQGRRIHDNVRNQVGSTGVDSEAVTAEAGRCPKGQLSVTLQLRLSALSNRSERYNFSIP